MHGENLKFPTANFDIPTPSSPDYYSTHSFIIYVSTCTSCNPGREHKPQVYT